MIEHIHDTDAASYLRHWSERVYDRVQLAQIQAIEDALIDYATNAWRPMSILPPQHATIIGACEEGLLFLMQNEHGEWRTSFGQPHKPPRAWMPAPKLPKTNGTGESQQLR